MKTETIQSIFIGIIVITIIIGITVLTLSKMGNYYGSAEYELTKEKCCGGMDCTDTYYSERDQQCHSSFESFSLSSWISVLAVVIIGSLVLTILFYIVPNYDEYGKKRKK